MRRGFTLIEIMVALGLFLLLITLMAIAQHNIGSATERSLQLAEIHSKAGILLQRLREDFSALQPQAAMQIRLGDLDTDLPRDHVTFARSLTAGVETVAGGWNKEAPLGTLTWVRWSFSPERGLERGESLRPLAGFDNTATPGGDDYSKYGTSGYTSQARRRPLIVREFKYFDNRGDPEQPDLFPEEMPGFPQFTNDNHQLVYINRLHQDAIAGMSMNVPQLQKGFRLNAQLGNSDPGPWTDHYAARGPIPIDGWDPSLDPDDDGVAEGGYSPYRAVYHKARQNLLGLEPEDGADFERNDAYYPSQMRRMADNVELFSISYLLRNGTRLPLSSASTAPSLGYDRYPRIWVDGARLDPRQYTGDITQASGANRVMPLYGDGSNPPQRADANDRSSLQKALVAAQREVLGRQPVSVHLRFIMHSMSELGPETGFAMIDGNAPTDSINYLRHEFYSLPVADRSYDLLRLMIEKVGHSAVIIDQVIPIN